MALNLEEQEKIASIKAWWEKWNGVISVISAIVAVALIAYYAWNWYEVRQAQKAQAYYEVILSATDGEDAIERVLQASKTLREDYADTAYASRGVLLAAHFLQAHNKIAEAKQNLTWLIDTQAKTFPEMQGIARLRLANIYIDEKHYDDAKALLTSPDETMKALFLDRLGDVEIAQGHQKEALAFWQTALQQVNLAPEFADFIRMKMVTLGGVF